VEIEKLVSLFDMPWILTGKLTCGGQFETFAF
jgi:hypothetical protein